MTFDEKLIEVLRSYDEECRNYGQEAAMANSPTPGEVFTAQIKQLISETIDDYFENLVLIPDPQKTKIKLRHAFNLKKE